MGSKNLRIWITFRVGQGEGLFLKRHVKAQTVVAFYNGVSGESIYPKYDNTAIMLCPRYDCLGMSQRACRGVREATGSW